MQSIHDIRLRRLGLALATAGFIALPAAAQNDFGPRAPGATVAVEPAPAGPLLLPRVERVEPVDSSAAIQSGANNAVDQALAERVATAIAEEPRLDGATVTVSANDGRVSISGSADSPEQGAIAEQVARDVAGPAAVSGTLSPLGG